MLARITVVVVLTLSIFGSTAQTSAAHSKHVEQAQYEGSDIPAVQVAVVEAEMRDLFKYFAAVDQANLAAYLDAVKQAQTAQVTQARSYPSNNGAHSDAWWQAVSVCEQGGRNDPFFGYFSIMNGSAGGLDWATQVAMANSIIASYGDGAWAASCVAAGYEASPSG